MSEPSFAKFQVTRLAPVDSLAVASPELLAPRIRHSAVDGSLDLGDRLMAKISERLSANMVFGRLHPCDLYTIGQLSTHLRVSLRALRFYEQSGLLHPVREGTKRLYSRHDLDRLKVIVVLREMEVPMTALKSLMKALEIEENEAGAFGRIEQMLAELRMSNAERISELHRLNDRIGSVQERLRPNG